VVNSIDNPKEDQKCSSTDKTVSWEAF